VEDTVDYALRICFYSSSATHACIECVMSSTYSQQHASEGIATKAAAAGCTAWQCVTKSD